MQLHRRTPRRQSDASSAEEADILALISSQPSPLLLIKITGIRLLNTILIAALGVGKAVLSYQGQSTAPTTLEWVSGVLCACLLYWLSLFEAVEPPVLIWLLHDDYAFVLVLFARFMLESTFCFVPRLSGSHYVCSCHIHRQVQRNGLRVRSLYANPGSPRCRPVVLFR
ncbi:hypothetical protein FA95DRAFT_1495284 [Auriscalpium vulgare]|uniref:Uncharacterized protein n=1 Tax=Auriscalpium vulgare TaxID=40419 RepID=A0ACB8RNW1_9AGAM|nr:hypothetical protein FA95DRAFT_1495284 [Auriscalpium vulgare]